MTALIHSMLNLAPECNSFYSCVQTISVDQIQHSMFIYSISCVATSLLKPFEKLLQSPRPSQVSACLKAVDGLLVARRMTFVRVLVPVLAKKPRSLVDLLQDGAADDRCDHVAAHDWLSRGLDLSFYAQIVTNSCNADKRRSS
jgi:hypothetical protein